MSCRYSVDTNQVIKLAHEKVLEDVGVREVLGPPVRKTNCFASITTGSTIGMRCVCVGTGLESSPPSLEVNRSSVLICMQLNKDE